MNVSSNDAANRKYRNIKPWLCRLLGTDNNSCEISRKPHSRRKGLDKLGPAVEFNSIPVTCFLGSTQHLVTSEFATPSGKSCQIQIFNGKGGLVNTFPTEVQSVGSSTFGICALPEYHSGIAVCMGNGIGIWHANGRLLSKMVDKNVENCCHVTSMKNGLLVSTCITETKGRCVTIWDPKSGKVVGQFGSRPEVVEKNPLKATHRVLIRVSDIRLPWFLAANSRDEVFISDRNAKCVKVFDVRNGSFIKSFDVHGVDTRCKKTLHPQGLCFDEDDNLIVVDNAKKSLLLFDRHGEYVRTLDHTDQLTQGEPWAVSMATQQYFPRPIMRSRVAGNDNARTLALTVATPDPVVGLYKFSFCPHYTDFI